MIKKTLSAILLLLNFAPVRAEASDKSSYLHFVNGLVLERKGNYDLALQEYKTTMLLDPQSVFVYKQALNLALHTGRVAEAEEWAKYVVSADSACSDNRVLYGNVQWAKGNLEGARASFEKAAALDNENFEAVYQLASLWSAKDPDKAAEYLRRYLVLKPDEAPNVYYQLALLYNVKGNYEEMKKNLLKSKKEDSMYIQPRYMLANYYEVKNDTGAALNEYLELLAIEGRNVELLNHIGEIHASPAVNNLAEAEKYFIKSHELDKTNPVACFWLSVIAENRRDFAASAAVLENSKDLKKNPATVLRLSYYYTQSGRYKKAITLLEGAHEKWPDNPEIAYFLALGYDDTRKTAKAMGLFKGMLAKNPEYTEARLQYATILERDGDIAAAEKNFRYLLAKDPNNANILNYLGYALADRGLKLDEAEVMISSAVKAEPANGAFQDSLAWVHFKQGRVPQALEEIRTALRLISDDATVWDHTGEIYAASGDWKGAWRAYNISFLLERPDKRKNQLSKIKNTRKQLPKEQASALTAAFLRTFSPGGKKFSAFAKVYASFKGKRIKLDGIVRFSPPDDFSFTLMGPLMAPLWKIKAGGGAVEMDAAALKEVDENAFNYWASLMAAEFKDYLSGAFLDANAAFPDGWSSDYLLSSGRKVYLNGDGNMVDRIVPLREKKLQVRFSGYFFKNMYLLPQTIEFKIPFFSVKVVLDKDQINLKEANILGP
ncbi:MAG: tetratricopeptide repeat protein [Elusimicrobia bacterium]|nr:tetratricopeptide repeat protein [Elusimicrobiota bacterium]